MVVRVLQHHAHRPQRLFHPTANLLRRHAEVFRPERHVLLDNGGDELVVRVLQHHAHRLADVIFVLFVRCAHALHEHLPAGREQQRVKVFRERGFARAVVAEQRDKTASLDREVDPVQHLTRRLALGSGIGERHLPRLNQCLRHRAASSHARQRAVEPQGSAQPFAVTGSPISSASTVPPKRAGISAFKIYCITDGDNPVVYELI